MDLSTLRNSLESIYNASERNVVERFQSGMNGKLNDLHARENDGLRNGE